MELHNAMALLIVLVVFISSIGLGLYGVIHESRQMKMIKQQRDYELARFLEKLNTTKPTKEENYE
jgi:hypothetical protein